MLRNALNAISAAVFWVRWRTACVLCDVAHLIIPNGHTITVGFGYAEDVSDE